MTLEEWLDAVEGQSHEELQRDEVQSAECRHLSAEYVPQLVARLRLAIEALRAVPVDRQDHRRCMGWDVQMSGPRSCKCHIAKVNAALTEIEP